MWNRYPPWFWGLFLEGGYLLSPAKPHRPGTRLVLANIENDRDAQTHSFFEGSTTIGIRHKVSRSC